MAENKKCDHSKCDRGAEKLELSYTPDGKLKSYNHFGKSLAVPLKKLKYTYCMTQSFWSFVFTQKNWKHTSTRDLYRIIPWMSIAALFVIDQNGKQYKCTSTGKWINKL